MTTRVGFIGLGTMGLPMAYSLRQNGFDVLGWDIDASARDRFEYFAESLDMLAGHCDIFITMLPEGRQVAEVCDKLLGAGVGDHCLFIDSSTIDVETTRRLAARLGEAGHGFVDAPVSGGSEGAAIGVLSFMVGGTAGDIDRARPVLEAMGNKIAEFGEAGSGQAAKACHNMICGITALGVCEAFALADALGLEPGAFLRAVPRRRGAELDPGEPLSGCGARTECAGLERLRARICRAPDGQGPRPRAAGGR